MHIPSSGLRSRTGRVGRNQIYRFLLLWSIIENDNVKKAMYSSATHVTMSKAYVRQKFDERGEHAQCL